MERISCLAANGLGPQERLCSMEGGNRGSRGIRVAQLFLQPRRQIVVSGQPHAPAALPSRKRPGTHCAGGWVGHRADVHGYGKSRPYWDSNPGRSSPQRVAISTELSYTWTLQRLYNNLGVLVYHLIIFFHVWPANQTTVTGATLYKKKARDSWYKRWPTVLIGKLCNTV